MHEPGQRSIAVGQAHALVNQSALNPLEPQQHNGGRIIQVVLVVRNIHK